MDQYLAVFKEPVAGEVDGELAANVVVNSTYVLSNHSLIIRSHAMTPKVISDLIGLSSGAEQHRTGVVFKLNGSYHGYYQSKLWDWLSENRE